MAGLDLHLIANFGIRGRAVVALTLLMILVFVLGHHFVVGRVFSLEETLRAKGTGIASQLAAQGEAALLHGDRAWIEQLIHEALLQEDVTRIVVRDTDGNVFAEAAAATGDAFEAPLASLEIVVHEQVRNGQEGAGRILGTIEIDISKRQALLYRQSALRNLALLVAAMTLLGMFVVFRAPRAMPGRAMAAAARAQSAAGEPGQAPFHFSDMAQAMEHSQSMLRNEVTEATARLQQTIEILEHRNLELDAARKKALAASEEKANFLANMSHEIRTPINVVLGYTEMLERSGLSQEQHEYARTINFASTQLLRVIDDILSFSRLESGTVELDDTDFDLRHTFEDVLCMMAPEARNKQLELVLTVDSDVPNRLVGDPARVGQIFINLLNNAIKFTERGTVAVRVTLLGMMDGRAEIEVRVTDTGIGIAPEALDRIFTSFHQADASISRRYGGTGLGLAIVSRLVQLWGGRVGVTSQPGVGSTFWFTLICQVRQDVAPELPDPALAGRKVLVYDDNPAALRALRNLLLAGAMEVFVARGRERIAGMLADAQAAGAPFELVILGLRVAEGEGDVETERLVDLVRRGHALPLLLMVNCDRTALFSCSLRDDAVRVILKPVRRHIFYRQLCALLGLPGREPEDIPHRSGSESPPEFAGLRVLLAEDNGFNRDLVTRMLDAAGARVTQATSGDAALELGRSGEFDLVILDLHLPGMDGAETARRLRFADGRAREGGRAVPIIALTADVFASERLGDEIDACLTKPVDERKLWRAIRRLCGGRREADVAMSFDAEMRFAEIRDQLRPRLLVSIAEQRQRIAGALTACDFGALLELAHDLKGVVGYFGLREFSEAVAEFEQALSRSADAESLARQLALIDAFIERLGRAPADESSA